jgi:hypothetical protein
VIAWVARRPRTIAYIFVFIWLAWAVERVT